MRRFFSYISFLLLTPLGFSSANVYAGEMSKAITDHAYNTIDSAIESWASENIPNLRLLEIETTTRNNNKPDIRFLTILSISESEYEKYYLRFHSQHMIIVKPSMLVWFGEALIQQKL